MSDTSPVEVPDAPYITPHRALIAHRNIVLRALDFPEITDEASWRNISIVTRLDAEIANAEVVINEDHQ